MPSVDWVLVPVPVTYLYPPAGNAAGNAANNAASNTAGNAACNTAGCATHIAFHMVVPPFLVHNPFVALHPDHLIAIQQGRALHPFGSNALGGAPQGFRPSLSMQTAQAMNAAPANNPSIDMLTVQTTIPSNIPSSTQTAVANPPNGMLTVQTTVPSNRTQTAVVTNAAPANDPSNGTVALQTAVATNVVHVELDASNTHTPPDAAVTTTATVKHDPPKKKARITALQEVPTSGEENVDVPTPSFGEMEVENAAVLAQDDRATWKNGVVRFNAERRSAANVLAWLVENTSRKLSVVATDALALDGFHNWDAVHTGTPNNERQLRHTFVIARAQRARALKAIPGLADLVDASKAAIESLHLKDTPKKLEWLTGHVLNQGDVNARFAWHQDTNEERKERGGRRDRRVLYSVIVKLNRGGCTSMQICGEPEVYYHSPEGSGLIFRSDLHHRTEKAEPGVWKLAMFFGVFL